MIENFCKYCILQGAEIFPLNVSADDSAHLGICNPSIFDDGDKVYVSLRNVNYMLFNNINKKFQTYYGEMVYTTPDDDAHLRTRNYLAEYDLATNSIKSYNLIDTSDFDIEPVWDFIGHEDIRLVRWNGKLYATGCRRDVKENGESRMELSELDPITGKELSRVRIKAPGDNTSYCEKNWMPILDMPFHYMKWTNPTEVVKVDPITGDCESLFVKEQDNNIINTYRALRGSSQVIPYKNGYIALLHEVDLYLNELERKECQYYMKWVVFDKDFNITETSDEFKFLNFSIEFTNGLMYKDNHFYIPFSIMDNVSFIIKVPEHIVMNFIHNYKNDEFEYKYVVQKDNIYRKICLDASNPEVWFELGEMLEELNQHSQAATCYAASLELDANITDDVYKYAYSLANSFSKIGHRDLIELSLWENCISVDSSRSEAFENIARYYKWRNNNHSAYIFAKLAYELNNYKKTTRLCTVDKISSELLYYEMCYYCNNSAEAHINLVNLYNKLIEDDKNTFYIDRANALLETIQNNKSKIKKVI